MSITDPVTGNFSFPQKRERLRNDIFELMYNGTPLITILEKMVLGMEEEGEGMLCSILILDKVGKHFSVAVAPGLPEFYNKAILGVEIGKGIGSCGTAAYTGKRVVVE